MPRRRFRVLAAVAPPATAGSVPSSRGPARNCGPPVSTTTSPRFQLLIWGATASSTWPSPPPRRDRGTTSRCTCRAAVGERDDSTGPGADRPGGPCGHDVEGPVRAAATRRSARGADAARRGALGDQAAPARLRPLLGAGAVARLRGPLRRSEEHTSELQSQSNLVCRLLLEKKKHTSQSLFPRLASVYIKYTEQLA